MPAALLATAAVAAPAPPPAGAPVSYQLGGPFPVAAGVVVDRDRTAPMLPGHYGICYVNAFQAQRSELGWWRRQHPSLLLRRHGREVVDEGWDEPLLDIGTPRRRAALARIVGGWMDGCARAGYSAVEPDNLDSWTRSRGALDAGDAMAFARRLIRRGHAAGLAVAQKNTPQLAARGRRAGFDLAVVEECERYRECGRYERAYGDAMVEVEYTPGAFARACAARGARVSVVLRDRDVRPLGQPGAVERRCPTP